MSSPQQPASSPAETDDERELRVLMTLLREEEVATGESSTAPQRHPSAFESLKAKIRWSKPAEPDDEELPDPFSSHSIRDRSLGDAVLPTSMSCQQAFDLAWSCQSPVGQWRAVYRNGSVQPCSQLWDDFWFCMRVKGFTGAAREEAVRNHYRERETAKYYAAGKRSSEDVWRSRTVDEVLPPGAVFQRSFSDVLAANKGGSSDSAPAPADKVDAANIRADMERRQAIRKEMGYEGEKK